MIVQNNASSHIFFVLLGERPLFDENRDLNDKLYQIF